MARAAMERPRVIVCNVSSVDGRLTIAPEVSLLAGDARWSAITGHSDPYHWIRQVHDPDVLLEGSGSFVAPDAPPIDHPPSVDDAHETYDHHLPADIVGAAGRRWMAVVDGQGRVALQFTEWPDPDWAGWHALIVASRQVSPSHLAWLRTAGIPYLVAGDGPVDLAVALQTMGEQLGVRTVVSTAGGRLNGALLRAGLVDEIDIEFLPAAIGGRGTPALFDAPPLGADEAPVRLELLDHQRTEDDHLRVRYAVGGKPGPREDHG